MQVSIDEFHGQVRKLKSIVDASSLSAERRFEALQGFDPYAEKIPPALLNAGHIATYALAAGMIEPFDIACLAKPATYLVSAEGPVRYRNAKGHVERFYLTSDASMRNSESCVRDHVDLAPNSVCFLTLEPTFRMPSYMAARFNLLIRDVYRGLLVGTGPLVDPGFHGKLSIPIHNFTSRAYTISAGEGLVYFEFTKLSWTNPREPTQNIEWVPEPVDDQPPFPSSKNNRRTLDDYLAAATGGGPPQSSIGLEIANIQNQTERARTLLAAYTLGGFAAAIALLFTGWSVYSAAQQFAASAQTELRESRSQLATEVQNLKAQVEEYKSNVDATAMPLKPSRSESTPQIVPAK